MAYYHPEHLFIDIATKALVSSITIMRLNAALLPLGLISPIVVHASPVAPSAVKNAIQSAECIAVNAVVKVLSAYSSATPFCSSFLKIPTITQTATATLTSPTTAVLITTTGTNTVVSSQDLSLSSRWFCSCQDLCLLMTHGDFMTDSKIHIDCQHSSRDRHSGDCHCCCRHYNCSRRHRNCRCRYTDGRPSYGHCGHRHSDSRPSDRYCSCINGDTICVSLLFPPLRKILNYRLICSL